MPRGLRLLDLHDAYRFPGFRPDKTVIGVFGDRYARVVTLHRRKKGRPAAAVAGGTGASTKRRGAGGAPRGWGNCRVGRGGFFSTSRFVESSAWAAAR